MSNNAFLLNTPKRVSDLASLSGQWLIVAEARQRIPLPWLCMFLERDLRPCTITFSYNRFVEGVQKRLLGKFSILNPSTSVEEAKHNLAQSRGVFEALAGDPQTGAKHWNAAMAALSTLPSGYVTIDPTEILLMGDLKAGAIELAAAMASDEAALKARRKLAGLDGDAPASNRLRGLDGGFFPVGWFQKGARSAEATKALLERLAQLSSCNIAETEHGYETLPLDLDALHPPERFWDNAELMEEGSRRVSVTHGSTAYKDGRMHYSTSLTNNSSQKVRVRMFGGFSKVENSYVLANYTKRWFTAKDFADWFGVTGDGWIKPGETVTDASNWGGNDDGFWAYWCEAEDKRRFIAHAAYPSPPAPESYDPEWEPPWQRIDASTRKALDTNIVSCIKAAQKFSNRKIGLDREGVQWLDDFIEELRGRGDIELGNALLHVFGAFLGECMIRNFGGEWAIYDGSICVRDEAGAVFPLNKVKKQLANGRAEGDSVAGMYSAQEVIQKAFGAPINDWQERFRSLYERRKDCQCYVLRKMDGKGEWARVIKIMGPWITIENALAPSAGQSPEHSVLLAQIGGFLVTDAYGTVIDSEGYSG